MTFSMPTMLLIAAIVVFIFVAFNRVIVPYVNWLGIGLALMTASALLVLGPTLNIPAALLLVALVAFILAGGNWFVTPRVTWVGLGLAFLAAATILSAPAR